MQASEAGGALAVSGGLVLLANQTVLRDNTAPSGAFALLNANGSLAYGLPAPLGYYIAEPTVCEVTQCDPAPCTQHTDTPDDFVPGVSLVTKFVAGDESLERDFPFACPAGAPRP